MTDRRFTDKEVALILRRASDLEKRSSSSAPSKARGLTLQDLKEIAAEAGIDPELVGRAVAELESPKGLKEGSRLAGPGTVRREVRAIPRELTREELAELFRVVDAEVNDQGTVAEALGSFRWSSKSRFVSTQVSLDPGGGETLLRVEERFSDAIRGGLHGIPASYGAVFSLAWVIESLSLGVLPETLIVLASAVASWSLGGAIWRFVSSRSKARVQRLAERLGLRSQELRPAEGEPPGGTHTLPGASDTPSAPLLGGGAD
jgi:hypothetical protein